MTDRLSTLLHDEAARLAVPPPAPDGVLRRGRSLRRTRRLGQGTAALAALAVLAAGLAAFASGGGDGARAVDPAGRSTGQGAAFSLGTSVFYDGGTSHVSIDDKAIKSSYYTSAGLLVRHGNNNYSDGGGPQRFSLVTPEGVVTPVSVVTEDVVPGVDPGQPYLAYTEVRHGTLQVVVHDVAADREVARVDLPGDLTWGGWSGPPVALSGDTVYVGFDLPTRTRTVNWRTGRIGTTDVLPPGQYRVNGGRTVIEDGNGFSVVDAASGEALLSVSGSTYLQLSPEGTFATLDSADGSSVDVYDVATGSHVTLEGQSWDYGWTPDGDLFRVADHHVLTCSSATGDCSTGSQTIPSHGGGVAPEDLRYGNKTYES